MADFADLASDLTEKQLEQSLRKAETERKEHERKLSIFKGICLNCETPISVGTVCDEHCREDYEKRVRK